jgi:hypothetical protein
MSGSPWTSSIQLHPNFLKSKAICPREEVLISVCCCCCGCKINEQQGNDSIHGAGDDKEEDRTCVMMILEAFPSCLDSDYEITSLLPSFLLSSSNRLETMCCSRARMHPFLEEFLLCAAAAMSSKCNEHCCGDDVFVQVADPNYDDGDDDYDNDYNDDDHHHHGAIIMDQRYFHVDKIDVGKICNIQNLLLNTNHDVGLCQIHVSLQYICSTRENYDTEIMPCLFQECGRDIENGGVDDNEDKNLLRGMERRRQDKILSLLKKSLEHRTMKKGCFLAINMMPMGSFMDGKDWDHDSDASSSSSSSFWNDNHDGDDNDDADADDFITIFRVCDLTVSSISSKDGSHPILLHCMNQDQYYLLGSCNSGGGGGGGGDEHFSVHIHVMMPSEKDGGEENKTSAIINQSNVIQQNIITTCPGYESLVDEIVALANISIRGGSLTGVAIVGCAGVGKTRLVSTVHVRMVSLVLYS